MPNKYVLFVPLGGFNDCLVQINKLMLYCKKFNRVLLLDMTLSEYGINCSDFFHFSECKIINDTNDIKTILSKNMTIYPNNLGVTLADVINKKTMIIRQKGLHKGGRAYFDRNKEGWHTKHGVALKLPPTGITEDIIFYVSCGGGTGFNTIKHIRFKPLIISKCTNKLSILGDNYLCIQVRCTDRMCDYKRLYENNKKIIHSYGKIYVATDNKVVLTYFRKKGLNIYNFTSYPKIPDVNLHSCFDIPSEIKFSDMIVDIYLCVYATKLISNSKGGFISFIYSCRNNINIFNECFHQRL